MSIIPSTEELLAEVQSVYKDAFGNSLSLEPSSVAGLLIGIDTANITDVNEQLVMLASQFSIDNATGQYLDSLCNIFNIIRKQATQSYAQVTFTGDANTLVAVGVILENGEGKQFKTTESGYTSATGSATLQVVAVDSGAIPVNANSITELITPIAGIDDVNNEFSGTIGFDVESDTALRNRFYLERSANSTGSVQSVIAQVSKVAGVARVQCLENFTDSPKDIDGVTLPQHSINVIVQGGNVQDVATAIQRSKSAGCGMLGDVKYTLQISGVDYAISFDRPIPKKVGIKIEAKNISYTGDLVANLTKAIEAYFSSTIAIGQEVSPVEVLSEVACNFQGVFFTSSEVNLNGGAYQTSPIEMNGNELATVSSISVDVL